MSTHSNILGTFQKQSTDYEAFIPGPFPPQGGFVFDEHILSQANEALLALGRLNGITQLLPNLEFFIMMYVRKDAASSSQIEGTRATMMDTISVESEISDDQPDDVSDIIHYMQALECGRGSMRDLPLGLRLIRMIHEVLMQGGRKTQFADPGNFRTSQNWIGGTKPSNARFVPPPPHEMIDALKDLELFIHTDDIYSDIIKAGLIHAQFETIHPFLDGNGRAGRLLITLYLENRGLLYEPILFLSSFFQKHQSIYYEKLQAYHHGDINGWLDFFLEGVTETANEATEMVKEIAQLREYDMKRISELGKTASESAIIVLENLYQLPIVNVAKIQQWTGFTRQGAQKVIDRLMNIGILEIKDEQKTYGRSYVYRTYVEVFDR